MKTDNIMIGDLLFYKGKLNAFPFRVEQITKKKIGYYAEPDDHRMYYLNACECSPIPLTEDILEKNGFPYNKEETEGPIQNVYKHYTKFFNFPLGRGFYIEHDTVDNIFYITDHAWIRFQYLHEFQHVLRLCGINNKISL